MIDFCLTHLCEMSDDVRFCRQILGSNILVASHILQVVKGKSVETTICDTTFRMAHPTKSLIPQTAQMRISSRKLKFSTKFLYRSNHPGHYQTGQSTLQLSKMH